jgi:hypothetical protein
MPTQLDLPPLHAPLGEIRNGRVELTPPWQRYLARQAALVRGLTESGTTAERPTQELYVGRRYFDTTTGALITWDGAAWV